MWGKLGWVQPGYTPDSRAVQSDDEFNQQWQRGVPERYSWTDVTADNPLRTEAANSLRSYALGTFGEQPKANSDALGALYDQAAKLGVSFTAPTSADTGATLGFNPYTEAGGSAYTGAGGSLLARTSDAPTSEYTNYMNQWKGAADDRAANQTRQANAYGQMQGGNYFGGFMDERYTQPFSGQMNQGQANGDPTSGGSMFAPGASTFGDMFGKKKESQFRVGSFGGWGG
jgi:hypothetical protein